MNNRRRTAFRNGVKAPTGPPTTNLRAFFSFRQLPGYTGNCIQVQRTSDNATLDIGFTSGYIDFLSIAIFCTGTTGRIRTWYNQQSGWFNLTNSTHSTQPIIYTSGAVTEFNGKKAPLWAANNFLSPTVNLAITCKSVYAVFKANSFVAVSYLSWDGGGGGLLMNSTIGGLDGFGYVQGGNLLFTNSQENTNENIISYFFNPDKKILNNNANEATTASTVTDFAFFNLGRPGTSAGMVGYLKEVIIYDTASNYGVKNDIINEINSYYSIY